MINTAQSRQIYTIRTKAIVLAITVIVLDQFSKWLVTRTVGYSEFQNLVPGIALTLRHNTGAAFSLLAHASGWQRWLFSGIAVIMSLGITIWLGRLKNYKKDLLEGISLGLILGGAIGNLIDRILHGYVIDFILLYYQQYSFPAFNIADSAICIGAALLTYDLITKKD